jgi:hypothetical protein
MQFQQAFKVISSESNQNRQAKNVDNIGRRVNQEVCRREIWQVQSNEKACHLTQTTPKHAF